MKLEDVYVLVGFAIISFMFGIWSMETVINDRKDTPVKLKMIFYDDVYIRSTIK